MQSLIEILLLTLDVIWFIVIAHVIMSWLINFNVLNRNQPLVWQIWTGLERLLEPLYRPIRRMLPSMGGLDLSPLIVLLGIMAIEIIIRNNAAALIYG
jgi:YggT family protein